MMVKEMVNATTPAPEAFAIKCFTRLFIFFGESEAPRFSDTIMHLEFIAYVYIFMKELV